MQSSGDPSLLRRLAFAFGEGVAFRAGMKLAEDTMGPNDAAAATDLKPLADRLSLVEQRLGQRESAPAPQTDHKVIVAIVCAVEKHLEAQALKVQKRLDDLQATVAGQERDGLREQVLTMQREMLQSVAQIVAEQVSAEVAQRAAAIEASLQRTMEAAVAPLQIEIRDLRRLLADAGDGKASSCRQPAPRPAARPKRAR